jgi:hypothetical protein
MTRMVINPHWLPPGNPDLTFQSVAASSSNLTTHTFTNRPSGAEDTNKFVIVLLDWVINSGTAQLPSSVTIGGETATLLAEASPGPASRRMGVYGVFLPTGTTATVVVTFAVAHLRVGCCVLRLVSAHMDVVNVISTATSGTTSVSQAVTVPNGGVGVAFDNMSDGSADPQNSIWGGAGVTEVADQNTGGSNAITVGLITQPTTVSVVNNADGGNDFLFVAWAPS